MILFFRSYFTFTKLAQRQTWRAVKLLHTADADSFVGVGGVNTIRK